MGDLHTLLTCHKGVDPHAATAGRVMRERLNGGDKLAALTRCEFHVFGLRANQTAGSGPTIGNLLGIGRYYNPNKHHYGHFVQAGGVPWEPGDGGPLPASWPGVSRDTDLTVDSDQLFDALLGGPAPEGHTAVDVAAWAHGGCDDVVSGVLWRLVLRTDGPEAMNLGRALAVARGGRDGLLVNPHMECWLIAARKAGPS